MSIFSNILPKKKVKKGGTILPVFLRKASKGSDIADDRTNRTNTDLTTLRTGSSTAAVARSYAKVNPDFSHSIESITRFVASDSYTIVARSMEDATVDVDVTKEAQLFATRIDSLPTYADGFSPQSSIASITETLIPQALTNGDCAAELVLDKDLLPSHIQPISTNSLKYKSDGDREVPVIQDTGAEIVLDSPAIYIMKLSPDPESPYSRSWYEAAIQAVIASTQFNNDLRRSFRKASLPRVEAELKIKEIMDSIPAEIKADPEALKKELQTQLDAVKTQLEDLQPQDAVAHYDTVTVKHLSAGNISSHESVKTHGDIINGQLAAGLHTLPAILGRGGNSQASSTEAILFLKIAESLQHRINEVYSYLFTMAMRLRGYDVAVEFKYKKPSLRSDMEDSSFKAMDQSRILELLSLGFITDEEASIRLTGALPSGNYTELSGTGFRAGTSVEPIDNAYSNTSVSGKGVDNTVDQKNQNKGTTKPKSNSTTGN